MEKISPSSSSIGLRLNFFLSHFSSSKVASTPKCAFDHNKNALTNDCPNRRTPSRFHYAPEQMMPQLSKSSSVYTRIYRQHLSIELNFLFHFLLTNVIYLVSLYFSTHSSLFLPQGFTSECQLRFSQICHRFTAIQK